jgi:hypothetical protein
MTKHRVNGVQMDMTPAEQAVRDLDVQRWEDETPMRLWVDGFQNIDMDRTREDHIKDVKNGVADSPAEQARYDAIIAHRANKPQ